MENRVLKDHKLFKPASFEEGKHAVVGDCNGFTMQERWDAETPAFAKAILNYAGPETAQEILDYGCGVGRLSKEIIKQDPTVFVIGTDASAQMMGQAEAYVNSERFSTKPPQHLDQKFDIVYLVYVLQHVPAIEIREILARIHYHLKDNGVFIYCSSDYRMAIRYDQGGFFDDRFLGVDLRAEVSRFFELQGPLFTEEDYKNNPILRRMITGETPGCDKGLQHPALVYKKRKIINTTYFNMEAAADPIINKEVGHAVLQEKEQKKEEVTGTEFPLQNPAWVRSNPKKILLLNRLAPGDILVMTNAIRDLQAAYPGKFLIDVRTPCPDIFDNSPYIHKLEYDEKEYQKINSRFSSTTQDQNNAMFRLIRDGEKDILNKFCAILNEDILVIDMHYPLIHSSGFGGQHFAQGHREFLEAVLGLKIPQYDIRPQIFLSQAENDWPSPALVKAEVDGPYWVINAGAKADNTLKQYPFYQETVDLLKKHIPGIVLVQIGQESHLHAALEGVVDMRGKTSTRELFRLIAKAEGVISCVSFPMHIAAAFSKPCVVVAGAREGTRWELYPNHQFLYVNGCLPCAPYDGCWRGTAYDCNNKRDGIPLCMLLIRPEDIVWAIERYYRGGMLEVNRG